MTLPELIVGLVALIGIALLYRSARKFENRRRIDR